ncbi:EAST1 family heat-stable enterotoxin, partial [Escherichia coli]|nr:EAST1 family heat-stable enterotoxin [Escherichia coli]EJT1787329.1 EAST1 family heat-stable enterotoxin [Escherichia coli]EKG7198422.1 EAST1 family heat-stable enterotoxin [Escherichia coli]HDP5067307.1 EAST1 family heat-stable enterotoxin [Escherichia coli]
MNQESRLPPGSDFRRWVWITIAPFVTIWCATACASCHGRTT